MALLPDHPPASFTWRGIRRRVRRADGPERVFGEWWQRDAELAAVRDYFRVEDEAGERFWIYRAGDGEDAEHRLAALVPARHVRMSGPRYAELQVTSHFSLPARGVARARSCSRRRPRSASRRSAIADRNSLAGIVRAHEAAKATGVRLIVGCRLDLDRRHLAARLSRPTGRPIAALPAAVARQAARRQGASAMLDWADVVAYGEGLIAVLVPDEADDGLRAAAAPAARTSSATAPIWR